MNYLKAEHLKFKRTISNKLLWIAPLVTALFAWIVGGFIGFQYTSFYWWYAFLLPGTIAILCVLSHQKEEHAGKYYSVLSMPLDLVKFEIAKSIILVEKLLVSTIILALYVSISNIISPATAVYSIGHSIIGSIAIILASIWQVPLCLYFSRKAGMLFTIILNAILGILSPTMLGSTLFWWIWPYCWAGKMAESFMGIKINGIFTGHILFTATIPISLILSVLLFTSMAFFEARKFSQKEGK